MPTKVILDVDTGTDDAVALMTAALSPDIELVGATSVNGNTGVEYTTENTLRVFDWIGMPEIPVFRGMDRPIVRTQTELGMAAIIHKNLLDLPPCSRGATLRPEHAVDWLIDTYLASDGDIVLCPVGPLTNIAMAMQKEPRILDAIPEIVIMGGAHHMGNLTHSAEFNIMIDPKRRGSWSTAADQFGWYRSTLPIVPSCRPKMPSGCATSARLPVRRPLASSYSASLATKRPSHSCIGQGRPPSTTLSPSAPSSTRRS
jgi:Inosine-uridine preferring nucleoside hydrolase